MSLRVLGGVLMRLCVIYGLFFIFVGSFANASDASNNINSFRQAKKVAKEIYKDDRETFYCGSGYSEKGLVKRGSCGYKPRKNEERGKKIEWEHVVPAHAFGHARQCWREPESSRPVKRRTENITVAANAAIKLILYFVQWRQI